MDIPDELWEALSYPGDPRAEYLISQMDIGAYNTGDLLEMVHLAVDYDNDRAARFLIGAGVDVNRVMEHAIENRTSPENVKKLLSLGANPSHAFWTASHEAAVSDEAYDWHKVAMSMVQEFIRLGVDVNYTNEYNETALFEAVAHSKYDLVEVLLRAGARVEQPNGVNLVTVAVANHMSDDILYELRRAGGNYNGKPGELPPLWVAVSVGAEHHVRDLLEAGADPRVTVNGVALNQITRDPRILRALAEAGSGSPVVQIPERVAQLPEGPGKRRRM